MRIKTGIAVMSHCSARVGKTRRSDDNGVKAGAETSSARKGLPRGNGYGVERVPRGNEYRMETLCRRKRAGCCAEKMAPAGPTDVATGGAIAKQIAKPVVVLRK